MTQIRVGPTSTPPAISTVYSTVCCRSDTSITAQDTNRRRNPWNLPSSGSARILLSERRDRMSWRSTARSLFALGLIMVASTASASEHPHLLFDTKDLRSLRSKIGTGRPQAIWNRLVEDCKQYQDPKSPSFIDLRKPDF